MYNQTELRQTGLGSAGRTYQLRSLKKFMPLIILLWASVAFGQERFFGLGLALPVSAGGGPVPLFSLQYGGEVVPQLELRGTLDTLLLGSIIGLDALYSAPLPGSSVRWYAGGGLNFVYVFVPMAAFETAFGLHGTLGAEYLTRNAGFYGELTPTVFLGSDIDPIFLVLRVGVNFHL